MISFPLEMLNKHKYKRHTNSHDVLYYVNNEHTQITKNTPITMMFSPEILTVPTVQLLVAFSHSEQLLPVYEYTMESYAHL